MTFVDDDGETVLQEPTEYEYGTAVDKIEKPAEPTKAATAQYTYTFAGWSPTLAEVTGDNGQVGLWFMLMAASLLGLVVTAIRRRKFRR